jgi:hypothetical protein
MGSTGWPTVQRLAAGGRRGDEPAGWGVVVAGVAEIADSELVAGAVDSGLRGGAADDTGTGS